MYMYMYKGKEKFTKAQLIFIVEAAITAAFDRIETGLPLTGIHPDTRTGLMNIDTPTELGAWDYSALETCGMNLGVLYAQLTGDGLGVGDAIDLQPNGKRSIRSIAEQFVRQSVKKYPYKSTKIENRLRPNLHRLATVWTEDMFEEYLTPVPRKRTSNRR